jgi:hypothetical protein
MWAASPDAEARDRFRADLEVFSTRQLEGSSVTWVAGPGAQYSQTQDSTHGPG